jgi:hypothetical protein
MNIYPRSFPEQHTEPGKPPAKHESAAAERVSAAREGSPVRQPDHWPAGLWRSDQQRDGFRPPEPASRAYGCRKTSKRLGRLSNLAILPGRGRPTRRFNRIYTVRLRWQRTITALITAGCTPSHPDSPTAPTAPAAVPPARLTSSSRLTLRLEYPGE